jgi:hypothetical protein
LNTLAVLYQLRGMDEESEKLQLRSIGNALIHTSTRSSPAARQFNIFVTIPCV